MNKYKELVKKWLVEPEAVTQQELQDNCDAAYADSDYAYADDAAHAVLYAADYAYAGDDVNAEYWVKRYEELKEQEDE
jgi:hypothetical protein